MVSQVLAPGRRVGGRGWRAGCLVAGSWPQGPQVWVVTVSPAQGEHDLGAAEPDGGRGQVGDLQADLQCAAGLH